MDQSTFNHGNTGDTNPKGRSRSPLLELYTRSLRNEREEKIGHRTSAACGGRLRLCYTLDEGKESERETTNCPPKRVRSKFVAIIAEDSSRLWRNMAEQAPRLAELYDLGIQVVTHDLDTRSESSAVLGAVTGAMSEQYRKEIGRRT